MTDAIRQWVADQTDLTAIWLNPNAPRPGRPYATLQVTNSARVGRPWTGPVDAEGMAQVTFDRDVTISVQIYGSSASHDPRQAFGIAEDLRDSLELTSVRAGLADDGWSFRGVELLTDAPQLLDTTWEPRAVFDVRFGTSKQLLDDLGLIETVDIQGSLRVAKDKKDTISNVQLSSATFVHVGSEDITLSEEDGNILRIDEDGRLFAAPLLETRNW